MSPPPLAVAPLGPPPAAVWCTSQSLMMPDAEAALEEEGEYLAWGPLARRKRNVLSAPWTLSFSFGRALQTSVLKRWGGEERNVLDAQAVLLRRAKAASCASRGVAIGGGGETEEKGEGGKPLYERGKGMKREGSVERSEILKQDPLVNPYGIMGDGL